MKMSMNYIGGKYITKSCMQSETCSNFQMSFLGFGFQIACCKTDHCNSARSDKANLNGYLFIAIFYSLLIRL